MKSISHRLLGEHLAARYMQNLPSSYAKAFLLGCIQPDKNPTTYLKGSLRKQWLRGHNWENSRRFICRTVKQLERKVLFKHTDYYRLGKLIHYTADAFTYVHNNHSGANLQQHRRYEDALHISLLSCLQQTSLDKIAPADSVMGTIRKYHNSYMGQPPRIHTDLQYCLSVCHYIMCSLMINTKSAKNCKFSTISS